MAATKQRTRKAGASSSRRETKAKAKAKSQLHAWVLLICGVLAAALAIVEGESLWRLVHSALLGLFGLGAFVLPAALIYIAYKTAKDEKGGRSSMRLWLALFFMVLLCGVLGLFIYDETAELNFFETIAYLWNQGLQASGGGVASAVLGVPAYILLGKTGATFALPIALFFFLVAVTGITIMELLNAAKKPVKKVEELYTARAEQRQQNEPARRRRFNIDIPLDEAAPPAEKEPAPAEEEPAPSPAFAMPEEDEPEPTFPQGHSVSAARERLLNALSPEERRETVLVDNTARRPFSSFKAEEDQPAPELEGIDDLIAKAAQPAQEAPAETCSLPEEAAPLEEAARETPPEPETLPGQEVLPQAAPPAPAYVFPPISLLKEGKSPQKEDLSGELRQNAQILVDTLKSFGVQTRIIDIARGPAVTRYELQPSAGVKISKITGLADDIALNLAASGVRIEAPIPNKAAVGIEIPNKNVSTVTIRELIDSREFTEAASSLTVALGRDIAGNPMLADIAKMPHVLIAGSTGSGKSVCINSIITSILYKSTPEEVRMIMIDPKVVELGVYNGIPHLLIPVVTDPKKAAGALGWAVNEMLGRYKLFAEAGVRDLDSYNRACQAHPELAPRPRIVVIIDELADLMMASPNEVEDYICRLAQMARAAGMHLVIATQRPSVDVITGVIKANIPSRIAFAVSSQVDSRTILDMGGAEKLLGKGDMLFHPIGVSKPIRVQGCFVSDQEIEGVISFIKESGSARYDQAIEEEVEKLAVAEKGSSGQEGGSEEDPMLADAIECVVEAGQASTSLLQRRLRLGYARAARLIDEMADRGIIGPYEGSKPRQVLLSRERWIEMKMNRSAQEASQ